MSIPGGCVVIGAPKACLDEQVVAAVDVYAGTQPQMGLAV
jgi:hypothetical protein